MTKEELRKSLDFVNEERERLQKWVDYYKDHVIEQNKRINKAIEYIKSYLPNYDFDNTNLQKLLEILRGEDNDK